MWFCLQDVPLQIVAICGGTELDHAPIGLVPWQVGQQSGGWTECDGENAGDGWIESPSMTNALDSITAT